MIAGAVATLAALRVASRGRNIVARACLATCAAAVVWLLSDLLFLYVRRAVRRGRADAAPHRAVAHVCAQ